MLKPILDPDGTVTGNWKYLNDINKFCPGCGKEINIYDENIEYSRTKRSTHVFWHAECTGKVWH